MNSYPTDNSSQLPLKLEVPLFELVKGLSSTVDLVSPAVADHHKRVAYIAASIGVSAGLNKTDLADVLFASLVHDIGAFSFKGRLDTLEFETTSIDHGETGWKLLRDFPGFSSIAAIVRHHHLPYNAWPTTAEDERILYLAGIVHLADRVDVLLRRDPASPDIGEILSKNQQHTGTLFHPDATTAFAKTANSVEFWRGISMKGLEAELKVMAGARDRVLSENEVVHFSRIISQVIDFRSRFTATHSRGVAATSRILGEKAGASSTDCKLLYVAGCLHDLGKLGIPTELLEKPAKLEPAEFKTVQQHALYTTQVLSAIPGMADVAQWAGRHHERLDGSGYPFGFNSDTLAFGARVMAVADIFTALTEDRPYRAGMDSEQATSILQDLVKSEAIDGDIVSILLDNYEIVSKVRIAAQQQALQDFIRFSKAA